MKSPQEVVSFFGAIQSQDYPAARWATAHRTKKPNAALVDEAYNNGDIIRTHVMRPTWHFVANEDIKWTIDLTGPRLIRINEYYAKSVGTNSEEMKKGIKVAVKAMEGGKSYTRQELQETMKEKGFKAIDNRMVGHTLFQGEIEGLFCSGPIKNKKMSYMLIDERAPKAKRLNKDEALAELARRYFQSHSPAQLQDYIWWSGLITSEAKRGIEMLGLKHFEIDGKKYFYSGTLKSDNPEPFAYLLPNYDEYAVAYKDRTAIFPHHSKDFYRKTEPFLGNTLIVNGIGVGGWRREVKKDTVNVAILLFAELSKKDMALVDQAVEEYGTFHGKKATYKLI